MSYSIRKATIKDIPGIQKVITIAWNQTYQGIVNDDFLERLTQNEEARIQHNIETWDETDNILVLETDNNIIGFVRFGNSKDSNYPNTGEIFALYILQEYHKKGLGKQLIKKAVKEFEKLNISKMIIGCLEGNPSNNFYLHLGGKHTSTRLYTKTGRDINENIYYFENIKDI